MAPDFFNFRQMATRSAVCVAGNRTSKSSQVNFFFANILTYTYTGL